MKISHVGHLFVPFGGRPAPVRATFFAALHSWFEGDPAAVSALPGGLIDGEAAPNQVFPYGRYWGMETVEQPSAEDELVEVTVSAYAADDNAGTPGDAAARAAGDAFMLRLLDPRARGDWLFLNRGAVWREAGCLWEPPGKLQVAGKASGGRRVWRYDLWFRFFLALGAS